MRMKRIQKLLLLHLFIFLFAFLLNLFWEYLHTPLYLMITNHTSFDYFYMATVDGIIVLLIYWLVCLEARTFFWLSELQKHIALILISGIFVSSFIEVKNVYFTHVWSYAAAMPIIPFLGVGLSPVLQMIVTPLVTFYLVRKTLQKDSFL